jgi:serine phosphatase RsbU (regulator of sigma subunit)
MLYLFTDGYADQFGGPNGKKFKYKQMENVLLANSTKPMAEQEKMLGEVLDNWKGSLEQVDDILVLGIKI